MALIQPSKFLKIDYGMQGWTRLLDLNFHRLNSVLLKVPQLGDVYAPNGVQDKDILVWDATHERWVVTRFYDYFPLPTATGDVICTNLKISAADGYAFVDFAAADVLTDHVPYHSKLIITDSTGNKLSGFIKAAGTGETYGSELVTNGDMEDGDPPSGWTYDANTSASSVAGDTGQALKIVAVNPAGSHLMAYQVLAGSAGQLIKASMDGKAVSSSSYFFLTIGATTALYQSEGYTSSWATRTGYAVHTGSADLRLRTYTDRTGEGHFDNATAKQVLTPSTTGVTITSTPDGEVYNWASVDEGFDFYDPAGYTYTIEGQVEP